jgi:hypothetical protein
MSQEGASHMSERSRRNRIGLVLAAALCSALVAALPTGAAGGYADPSGDSGGAPDILGLVVTSDDATGQVSFRIVESNPTATDSITELDIDSDANPATGEASSAGADYAFQISPSEHSYGLWHWNGSDWVDASDSTVQVAAFGTGFTISVNKSELGGSSEFNFGAATFMINGSGGGHDAAPDDGLWNYSLPAHGPHIVSVLVATQPASGPKAGRLFSLTPTGLRLPPDGRMNLTAALPESYTCTAALGARKLPGGGTGGCTFRIPKKKARGKRLVVHLTVGYQGAAKSVDFPFVVK